MYRYVPPPGDTRSPGSNRVHNNGPGAVMTGRAGIGTVGSYIMQNFNRLNSTVQIRMAIAATIRLTDLMITEYMGAMAGRTVYREPSIYRCHNN